MIGRCAPFMLTHRRPIAPHKGRGCGDIFTSPSYAKRSGGHGPRPLSDAERVAHLSDILQSLLKYPSAFSFPICWFPSSPSSLVPQFPSSPSSVPPVPQYPNIRITVVRGKSEMEKKVRNPVVNAVFFNVEKVSPLFMSGKLGSLVLLVAI
jgi:hypothetical protein